MDEQIKQHTISQTASAANKTLDETVKQSLKQALPQEFLDKATDEAIKRLKSASIPEFNAKGNKIWFTANNEILEKINQAVSSIKKGNVKKCQEMLQDSKKLLLKQQKFKLSIGRKMVGRQLNVICMTISLLIQTMKNKCYRFVGKQLLTRKKE